MHRQIILDTETTGLDPKQGHRIIEIAGVEMRQRRLTGKHFHYYLNPQRSIDEGALRVHGITEEFLADKPFFKDIAMEFLDYIAGAELIIHNAPFDVAFLNAELALLDLQAIAEQCKKVTDTLTLARELHPGKRNSLDALCERYSINNANRVLHGALLDAELLAEVYLAMTRGQDSLAIELISPSSLPITTTSSSENLPLTIVYATANELAQHQAYLADLEKSHPGKSLWQQLKSPIKPDEIEPSNSPSF